MSKIKNILIVENSGDYLFPAFSFFESLDEITDSNLRSAVQYAIENPNEEKTFNDVDARFGDLFSNLGFVFSKKKSLCSYKLPITINHIVNHIF